MNSITWDKVGDAVANATYGGFVIITGALFIGKLTRDLPTYKRITEFILLLIGAIFYVVLGRYHFCNAAMLKKNNFFRFTGSLEFASLESIPPDLIDNAAVLGTLSLITASLFLLDLGGPKAKKPQPHALIVPQSISTKPKSDFYLEAELEKRMKAGESEQNNKNSNHKANGQPAANGGQNGYTKMQEKPKRFDIYGKDIGGDENESELNFDDATSKTELHSPVWSKIRKGMLDYKANGAR